MQFLVSSQKKIVHVPHVQHGNPVFVVQASGEYSQGRGWGVEKGAAYPILQ